MSEARFRTTAVVAVVSAAWCAGEAAAQPDYGLDWVTIGAPGNRATNAEEVPAWPDKATGEVEYEYRITRTEVTVGQYLEFVNAYASYWEGHPNDSSFTGFWIQFDPTAGRYTAPSESLAFPADMSFHFAARFCNWLHNAKGAERAAFEDGAYDASTFERVDGELPRDQITHHAGAKFWIPTLSEWDKAVYFDPNRYGPGQEGYWLQPDGGNEPLVSGLPWEGGETSGGLIDVMGLAVGLYPHVRSPWGLLDASGGVDEWTEGIADEYARARWVGGSTMHDLIYDYFDRLDVDSGVSPQFGGHGLRLAGMVPDPALGPALWLLYWFGSRRRRERE